MLKGRAEVIWFRPELRRWYSAMLNDTAQGIWPDQIQAEGLALCPRTEHRSSAKAGTK